MDLGQVVEKAAVHLGIKSQRENTGCRTVFMAIHFTIYRFRVLLLIAAAVTFIMSINLASDLQAATEVITLLPPDSNFEKVRLAKKNYLAVCKDCTYPYFSYDDLEVDTMESWDPTQVLVNPTYPSLMPFNESSPSSEPTELLNIFNNVSRMAGFPSPCSFLQVSVAGWSALDVTWHGPKYQGAYPIDFFMIRVHSAQTWGDEYTTYHFRFVDNDKDLNRKEWSMHVAEGVYTDANVTVRVSAHNALGYGYYTNPVVVQTPIGTSTFTNAPPPQPNASILQNTLFCRLTDASQNTSFYTPGTPNNHLHLPPVKKTNPITHAFQCHPLFLTPF